jgi:hypothetical protein
MNRMRTICDNGHILLCLQHSEKPHEAGAKLRHIIWSGNPKKLCDINSEVKRSVSIDLPPIRFFRMSIWLMGVQLFAYLRYPSMLRLISGCLSNF